MAEEQTPSVPYWQPTDCDVMTVQRVACSKTVVLLGFASFQYLQLKMKIACAQQGAGLDDLKGMTPTFYGFMQKGGTLLFP